MTDNNNLSIKVKLDGREAIISVNSDGHDASAICSDAKGIAKSDADCGGDAYDLHQLYRDEARAYARSLLKASLAATNDRLKVRALARTALKAARNASWR
jgi:hypothetical protein